MKLLTETVGLLEVNCYFIQPEDGGRLYVIDPGGDAQKITEIIRSFEAPECSILLTHAHVDHISAVGEVVSVFPGTPVALNPADEKLYGSPLNALEPFMPAAKNLPPTVWPPSGEGEIFQILNTPGHTRGSVCYYFKEANVLFTGDTLFCNSIGRTDLPGDGDYDAIIRSIKTRLFSLPDEVKVFPGHGPGTSIGKEKAFNPYFQK